MMKHEVRLYQVGHMPFYLEGYWPERGEYYGSSNSAKERVLEAFKEWVKLERVIEVSSPSLLFHAQRCHIEFPLFPGDPNSEIARVDVSNSWELSFSYGGIYYTGDPKFYVKNPKQKRTPCTITTTGDVWVSVLLEAHKPVKVMLNDKQYTVQEHVLLCQVDAPLMGYQSKDPEKKCGQIRYKYPTRIHEKRYIVCGDAPTVTTLGED